jgi:hypothetical protein
MAKPSPHPRQAASTASTAGIPRTASAPTTASTASAATTASEHASPAPGIERAKVLSVRLSADEFDALTRLATEIGVGPSTLARTLIRRGLAPASHPGATDSPLERAHAQRRPQSPSDLEELTARVAALEAWVAGHPAHDAT